ncbi:MAG: tRNA (adenosine(37)-N6)-threonylcarbamoyltransferase complex ATPase subunit type 1 TsaE [Candidatus Babeliales bacterium]
MIEKKIIYSFDERSQIIALLKQLLSQCHVMTFTGDLGAGKTTIIRELLRACGVTQPITSPTFTYLNVYKNEKEEYFYHFDLYRIHSLEEFQQLGFDEYLCQPNSWAFIEWPSIIMPLLDHSVCHIKIDHQQEYDKRLLQIQCRE